MEVVYHESLRYVELMRLNALRKGDSVRYATFCDYMGVLFEKTENVSLRKEGLEKLKVIKEERKRLESLL